MQVIWDAYKATIRGNLLALNVADKKKKKIKYRKLEKNYIKKNLKEIRERKKY